MPGSSSPHGQLNEAWTRYGPWAAVTGASDGIGRACAVELAAKGLNLVLVARRISALDALSDALHREHGIDARPLALDLATPQGVKALIDQTANLDIGLLVAAAGYGTSGPFLDGDAAQEADMLALNCGAVLHLSHHFGRRLSQRGGGALVLFGSLVGWQGVPYAAHYAATKAYVQSLAEGLRVELAGKNVQVLASAPGPVLSGFGARAGMRMGPALRPADVARGTLAALGRGRTTVVPGMLSKALTYSLLPLPRSGRVRMMGQIMRGMTKHRAVAIPTTLEGPA